MKVDSQGGTGTGAVYIYMGSRSGLEKDAVQVITYENDKYFIFVYARPSCMLLLVLQTIITTCG